MSLLRKLSNSSRATSPTGSEANSPSGRHLSMKLRFAILKALNHTNATFIRIPSGKNLSRSPKSFLTRPQAGSTRSIQHRNISPQLLPGLKAPPSASLVQEPEGSCSLRCWSILFWNSRHCPFTNYKTVRMAALVNGGSTGLQARETEPKKEGALSPGPFYL